MQAALMAAQGQVDAIAMAAAVADHRRVEPLAHKLSKQELGQLWAEGWEQVPDLLAGLVASRPTGQTILGFAAYSGDGLPAAREKLRRKGCDWLFANPIDQPDAGFGSPSNQGWLLGPGGEEIQLQPAAKLAIAHQLLTALRPPGPLPGHRVLPRAGANP
jgi:phosphopantothenoylcysteine decarboxylase/phosphopantothenate--cysteine ligase